MNKLERLYLFLKKFEIGIVLDEIFLDMRVQQFIFEAIKMRITEEGVTATFKKLITNSRLRIMKKRETKKKEYYAPATIRIKKKKSGLSSKTENVTLYDSGEFYESFRILTTKKTIRIIADMEKPEGDMYDNFSISFTKKDFIKEILSLSYDEKAFLLQQIVRPYAIQLIRKSLKSI